MSDQVPDLPEEKSKKRTAVEVSSEGALGAIAFIGSLLAASLSAYFLPSADSCPVSRVDRYDECGHDELALLH